MSDEQAPDEGHSSERGPQGWESAIQGSPAPEGDSKEKTPEDGPESPEETEEDLAAQDDLADAWAVLESEGETGDDEDADEPDTATPNREAAKWRHKLREVEFERDKLAEQVQALQRQQVENLAAGKLHDVADLWGRHDIGDLLDESGAVDQKALDAAIEGLPGHFRKAPEPLYVQGYQGKNDPKSDTSWGDILRRR